jgi:hypothetical protein
MHWKIFKIFSRTNRPNSIKLGTNYPYVKGIQVCSKKRPGHLQRGDNYKNVKMGWCHFRNLLQNCWANFNQTLHRSSLGKGDASSSEGDSHSPRGDNSKRVKMHWKFLKIYFSRTSRPNSIKLGTYDPWVKEIQNCTNEGLGPFQRRDNHKNGVGSFKNLLTNH